MANEVTNFGSIPHHWTVSTVADLSIAPTQNGLYKDQSSYGSGLRMVHMTDIFAHGRLSDQEMQCVHLSDGEKRRFTLRRGDLVFARRSLKPEGAGDVSLVEIDNELTFESSIIRFQPDRTQLDPNFAFYYFKSSYGRRQMRALVRQVAVSGITGSDLRKFQLPVPPIAEQTKIAQVLAAWDRAIKIVGELIEVSQRQKTALMQSLITSPLDSSDLLRTVRLSDVAQIIVSNVDKKSLPEEKPVGLCNYTDVYYNDYITSEIDFMSATATPAEIEKFTLRREDIVITKDSETPDDIAVPAMVDEDLNGVLCGYHLAIVRPSAEVDSAYLRALFSLKSTQHYFFTRANGATRFGLTVSAIADAVFNLPPLARQRAVARVLRAAERSARKYQDDLAKLRSERSALMQQLLTGKRRVVVNQTEEAACA